MDVRFIYAPAINVLFWRSSSGEWGWAGRDIPGRGTFDDAEVLVGDAYTPVPGYIHVTDEEAHAIMATIRAQRALADREE